MSTSRLSAAFSYSALLCLVSDFGLILTLIWAVNPNWLTATVCSLPFVFIISIVLILCVLSKNLRRRPARSDLGMSLWGEIIGINSATRVLSFIAVPLAQLTLLLGTLCFLIVTAWLGAHIVAVWTMKFGGLVPGERVYKAIPYPHEWQGDMSLISALPYSKYNLSSPEFPSMAAKLDQAIEEVYGVRSRQLAHMHCVIGELYSENGQASVAENWFGQSASLYKELDAPGEVAGVLGDEAISLALQGKTLAARQTVNDSLIYLAKSSDREVQARALRALSGAARVIGDADQADVLARKAVGLKSPNKTLNALLACIPTSLILALLLVVTSYQRALVSLGEKWKLSLHTTDLDTCVESLNKLIVFELWRNNLAQANSYSIQLLHIAEAGKPLPVKHLELITE